MFWRSRRAAWTFRTAAVKIYTSMAKFPQNKRKVTRRGETVKVGRVEDVPPGRGATVKLKDGTELALFNVNGTFRAIENFCPHKGYPLADSHLYGNIVECSLHGWRFDVATGACFTKAECGLATYDVRIEDGWILIDL